MQVGSVCTRHIVTVDVRGTAAEAARQMRDYHVGSVVVTRETPSGTQVCGIVTDRDLVLGVLAESSDPLLTLINVCAKGDLVLLMEDDSLEEAIAAMQAHGVRRLLVKDTDDRLCGILSIDDLLAVFAGHLAGLAGVIHSGMKREVGVVQSASPVHANTRFPGFGVGTWSHAVGGARPV